MKNYRKGWQGCVKPYLWLLLLLPLTLGISATPVKAFVTCPAPNNVTVTGKTSSSVSFSWSSVTGASHYLVYYVRLSDNYTSTPVMAGGASITVSGLSSDTYRFYFATVCGLETSDYIIIDDLLI